MSYSCTDYRLTTIPIRLTMRLCFRLNQCTRRYLRGNSASKPMSWAAIFTCRASNTQSHQFLNVPQYHESITEHHSTSQYDIISHQIISWCISYESCICIYIVRLRQSRLSSSNRPHYYTSKFYGVNTKDRGATPYRKQ